MRRYCLILGALCFISLGQAEAQIISYEGGSVYDLDPKASQSTGNAILERVLNSNDMQPVNAMAEGGYLRKLSRPVGRLALGLAGGKVSYCTASLIDKDHILTNYHCVPGKGDVREALLWMGYVVPSSRRGVAQYGVELKPIEASKSLDYVILKVKGDPGAEWGYVPLSTATPGARNSLFVVHHPGGFAKHISLGRCQTSDPAIRGDDVLHICDTLGGSSGAPIFDSNSRKVVGLHYSAVGLRDLNAGKRIASLAKGSKIIARILADAAPMPKPKPVARAPMSEAAQLWAEVKIPRTKLSLKSLSNALRTVFMRHSLRHGLTN